MKIWLCKTILRNDLRKKTGKSKKWSKSSMKLTRSALSHKMVKSLPHSWVKWKFSIPLFKIMRRQFQDKPRLKMWNFHTSKDKFMKILRNNLIYSIMKVRKQFRNLRMNIKFTSQVRRINWRRTMSSISISFKRLIQCTHNLIHRFIRSWTDRQLPRISNNKIWVCLTSKWKIPASQNRLKNKQIK